MYLKLKRRLYSHVCTYNINYKKNSVIHSYFILNLQQIISLIYVHISVGGWSKKELRGGKFGARLCAMMSILNRLSKYGFILCNFVIRSKI